MYIESVDIGLNYNNTEFFDYLGLQYLGDGGEEEVVKLKGGPNCLASELSFMYAGGYSPHYSLDRLESNGSELLMSSEDGYGRIFFKETPSYRSVSSSILLGAMASGDTLNLKTYLVSEMVNTFLGYNPSTALREILSRTRSSLSYPNPFSEKTQIEFNLCEPSIVILDVYNLKGEMINRIFDGYLGSGVHSVSWDATNETGSRVPAGYYFCKIKSGNSVLTEKMILLY